MTDSDFHDADGIDGFDPEQVAQAIWSYETNDAVWDAIFERGVDVAAELLTRIENTPEFTVGDLNQQQVIAAVHRRYPILGPNPGFTS